MSEIDEISIDALDAANRALDAWQEAEASAAKRGAGK